MMKLKIITFFFKDLDPLFPRYSWILLMNKERLNVKYKFLKKWSDLSPLDFGLVCTDMFGPKTCTW